ncbi:sulfotransferase domain-containing protein [Roseovarius sp. S88]|uniref:Sulfotransferase domain-containing protein n=1 Tax=Roseovarius phycicola TaxID=3080976 RepID=A0ABZ2HLW3_9RHOB
MGKKICNFLGSLWGEILQRPTDIGGMMRALDGFMTSDGKAKGLAEPVCPTDVFISPFAKCGTTWMQQIVHGLRTGGDMSFDEITAVTPWIEMAHDLGLPLEPQPGAFRAFKSHQSWDEIPKGGRYIVVLRDPVDAMVSLFRFFEGWFFETGSVSMEEFAQYVLNERDGRDYWSHLASWWDVRDRDDVLVLSYESMKHDLHAAVTQVADFLRIEDPVIRGIAEAQAQFAFMKAHERQFDDHLTRAARDAACGLPPGSVASKVNKGEAGSGKPLVSNNVQAAFAAKWTETIGARFGFGEYAALRAALEGQPG